MNFRYGIRALVLVTSATLLASGCNLLDANSTQSAPASGAGQSSACKSPLLRSGTNLRLTAGSAPSAEQVNALSIGNALVDQLKADLESAGYLKQHSDFIGAVASQSMSDAVVGSFTIDPNPVGEVMVPVIQGAFFALADPCSGLNDLAERTLIPRPIMSSLTASLSGRISEPAKSMVVIETMSGTATQSLSAAGLAGQTAPQAVEGIVGGQVGALAKAGFDDETIGAAAGKVAYGAVKALPGSGVSSESIVATTSSVAAAAIASLVETGLDSTQIMNSGAISAIVAGSVEGLTGITGADISVTIGGITAAAIGSFDKLAMSADLMKLAVVFVIAGAMDGLMPVAGNDLALVSSALSSVMKSSVAALKEVFQAEDTASVVSSMVEASIAKLADIDLPEGALVSTLAVDLVKGSVAGVADMSKAGFIDEAELAAAVSSASAGATAGFNELKQLGTINEETLTSLNTNINSTIASSLESGGVQPPPSASQPSQTVSLVGPTVSLGAPSTTSISNGGPATLALSFIASVSGGTELTGALTADGGGISVTSVSGDATCLVSVSGISSAGATITLSSCTGNGSLRVTANAGLCKDARGNLSTASSASEVINVTSASYLVYVPNSGNNTVTVHQRDGTLVHTISHADLDKPNSVAVASNGDVYVLCHGSQSVVRFRLNDSNTYARVLFSNPSMTQSFPFHLALDANDHMYVSGENRLEEYDNDANLVREIPSLTSGPWGSVVSPVNGKIFAGMNRETTEQVHVFGTTGTVAESKITNAALKYPYALAMDSAGNFYSSNLGNTNVTKHSSDGTLLLTISPKKPDGTNCAYGECSIVGLAVDDDGNIYLADAANDRVIEYAPNGTTVNSIITGLNVLNDGSSWMMGIAVR